jgi:hypothetical protein
VVVPPGVRASGDDAVGESEPAVLARG